MPSQPGFLLRRLRILTKHKTRDFMRWVENTDNLVHLSVLVFVPVLIGVVTWVSDSVEQISFFLFPPLASGTYTLFADPEGRYSSPTDFVAAMTAGALCGWVALEFSARVVYEVPPDQFHVHAVGAALGVLLTGAVTWGFDIELPSAFSTALLVLVTGATQIAYVVSVALSSGLVASVFSIWRSEVYEERARYLYHTTQADDHVLVPFRGDEAENVSTAYFGGRLAAAHEAGKVILMQVIDEEMIEAEGGERKRGGSEEGSEISASEREAGREIASGLEEVRKGLEESLDIPCQVVVAATRGNEASTVLETAEETNCDLIVTPYEEEEEDDTDDHRLSPFVRSLFRSDTDTVAFRSEDGRKDWRRVLVPVRSPGGIAHSMVNFARRLVGESGSVSVCTFIEKESERRTANEMVENLVEAFDGSFETRVSSDSIESFLDTNASEYDLVTVGGSTDRSTASRFVSPPTFERLRDVDCDTAVVHIAD
ncbi:MAG: HPP family protein [Halobacteria archaeon]|nr:HPP family protein [Halobacteria archaeon]